MASPRQPGLDDPLAGIALFAGLDPVLRQRIASVALPRLFRKGQQIFVEGDPGDSLLVLRRGSVAVYRSAATGDRAMLTVVRAPGLLGEVSLLDGAPRSASVEAIEDVTALMLSRPAFIDLVRAQPALLEAALRSLGGLIRRLTEQKADHVFLDLSGRVAKVVVRLVSDRPGPLPTIELSQTQVAELAGGSRQSVNQVIRMFVERGWLRTEGHRIVVVDLASLRRRAGLTDR